MTKSELSLLSDGLDLFNAIIGKLSSCPTDLPIR